MTLADNVAVVTGGASGLGRAIAVELAERGADVAIGDVREAPKGDDRGPTADLVRERGREAIYVETDVSEQTDCRALVDATVDRFGGIDVLVNNAGAFPEDARQKTVEELEEAYWDEIVDVNLKSVYNCTKAAMPHVKASDAGRVVNVASKMGLVGHKAAPAYSAAKGGIVTLTKQMAVDYAPDGVTVNVICPGVIVTGTKSYRFDQKGDRMERNTPLPYLGEPRDIANAAAFLAGKGGRFVTGHALVVDGGWTAQ